MKRFKLKKIKINTKLPVIKKRQPKWQDYFLGIGVDGNLINF